MIQTTKNTFVQKFLFMEIVPEKNNNENKYRIRLCIAKDLYKTSEFLFNTREEAIDYYNEQIAYPSNKINKEQIEYKIAKNIPEKVYRQLETENEENEFNTILQIKEIN